MTNRKFPAGANVISSPDTQRLHRGLYLVSTRETSLAEPAPGIRASDSERMFALASGAFLAPVLYVLLHLLHIF